MEIRWANIHIKTVSVELKKWKRRKELWRSQSFGVVFGNQQQILIDSLLIPCSHISSGFWPSHELLDRSARCSAETAHFVWNFIISQTFEKIAVWVTISVCFAWLIQQVFSLSLLQWFLQSKLRSSFSSVGSDSKLIIRVCIRARFLLLRPNRAENEFICFCTRLSRLFHHSYFSHILRFQAFPSSRYVLNFWYRAFSAQEAKSSDWPCLGWDGRAATRIIP